MAARREDAPKLAELIGPAFQALKDLGGRAEDDAIVARVATNEGLSKQAMALRKRPNDPQVKIGLVEYRLAWAKNELKNAGLVVNRERRVWALTDDAAPLTPHDAVVAVHR